MEFRIFERIGEAAIEMATRLPSSNPDKSLAQNTVDSLKLDLDQGRSPDEVYLFSLPKELARRAIVEASTMTGVPLSQVVDEAKTRIDQKTRINKLR